MNEPFVFTEANNSPDLTDSDILEAIATSSTDDIVPHLREQACSRCGKTFQVKRHEKRFRFPHFYWRSRLECPEGHPDQRVFQATWLYDGGAGAVNEGSVRRDRDEAPRVEARRIFF